MSKFTTPQAQMQAVKNAARQSPLDTQRASESFSKDRLLCRIFSEGNPTFILKGGQGMLARTAAARETRDIDVLGLASSLFDSLNELKRLTAIDLDDFLTFNLLSTAPIKATEEYREGLTVKFAVFCGPQRLSPISIDLVSDPAFRGIPQRVTPKTRLNVGDLPVFDYLIYPIEHVIADKVCATFEIHEGRPSSRIKDLVDLGVVALSEEVNGSRAAAQIASEFRLRKLEIPPCFVVPDEWRNLPSYRQTYHKLIDQTGYASQLADMNSCLEVVRDLINPLLAHSAESKMWNPRLRQWDDLR